MLTPLYDTLGPSTANWVVVIVSGLVFLGLAVLLPGLLRHLRGKDGPPLL
jgi:hypothetical protein